MKRPLPGDTLRPPGAGAAPGANDARAAAGRLPTYVDLVRELFPRLTGGIQWGLERTERLLASVGDPHRRYATLHVGGTNGKGSVAATLAAMLSSAGVRAGLYTSPHLCTFRERIQVAGRPVAEDALVAAAHRLWPEIRREQPSFFEATTALAFLVLAEADVDAVVVEVGLGGRLDATNVVRPEVAVLTNVAMDHAQYLGPTLASVAREKAGIIKAGVPAVTAEADPALQAVFASRAREVGAPFHVLEPGAVHGIRVAPDGTRFRVGTRRWGELALHSPLIGRHQALNAALAVRALECLPQRLRPSREAAVEGVTNVTWPGRLQLERIDGRHWVFDAAHNPAGVEALVAALGELRLPRPFVLLLGVLGDKDWARMLPPLFAASDGAVLTVPFTAPRPRQWDPAAVLREVRAPAAEVILDFGAALERARVRAGPGGTVLVTGSFHTVGDALVLLGRAPYGADSAADLPLPASTLAV